jgi:predicted HAD superfamily Cof-like phosphohydrolase
MRAVSDVHFFMTAFKQPTPTTVQMPPDEIRDIRTRLIEEELEEMMYSSDIVQYTDACIDLLYVVAGALVDAGIDSDTASRLWDEVHRSNMSKLWMLSEVYNSPAGADIIPIGGASLRFIVKLNGKIIKSPSYSPADLGKVLGV